MKHDMTRRSDYDFFDEAMNSFFPAFYGGRQAQKYMRTDIKETDDAYLMEVEIPGADKKDIRLDLNDGYLNISVSKNEKEEGGKKDNYIRRERSYSCSRSYYVGDVAKEDVKANTTTASCTSPSPRKPPKRKKRAISRSNDRLGTKLKQAGGLRNFPQAPFARLRAAGAFFAKFPRLFLPKIRRFLPRVLTSPPFLLYNRK